MTDQNEVAQSIYHLRLIPPLGEDEKHQFDNEDDLGIYLKRLLDKYKIKSLSATQEKISMWKKDPIQFFTDHIVLIKIDPAKCRNHKFLFM